MKFSYKNCKNPKTCRDFLVVCEKYSDVSKESIESMVNPEYFFKCHNKEEVDEVNIYVVSERDLPDSIMGCRYCGVIFNDGKYDGFTFNYAQSRVIHDCYSTYAIGDGEYMFS